MKDSQHCFKGQGLEFFVHEDNLEAKIRTNYKKRGLDFQNFKLRVYTPYKVAQLEIKAMTKEAVSRKVKLLEDYFQKADSFNRGNWISFQSKFRPTILEEFCGYLFKDLPQINFLGLTFFKKGVYAGLDIDRDGRVRIKTKDIDFCIGKVVEAEFGGSRYEIRIPIVGIECKTYIDNTMFSEAQFTAQKLKGGSPGIKVFVIAETNQIDIRQLPSQSPIDQIYILREKVGSPVDTQVVWEFFNEVRSNIEKVSMERILKLPGKLLIF